MSSLKYKTRGQTSPQGKPRVYFSCHPEDFGAYFEGISEEILALQNCAIWYREDGSELDEDVLSDLSGMQLFVMPVTTKLLCTENDALNVEFKLACEEHIPVLPLMQESELEELFNKKCGNLQFLEKNVKDITAIPYEEKLKRYLESVLIGDELAAQIREAFDAYVFLSYRKKDRKYAQELMRLIHKNDFCRDIAIWYDEFLTPGENFNDSIKDALEKSGLFVLAVTPNLVNEINYIMTTEYPMAREAGKPILPFELVETDREALEKSYDGIPSCTDAHDDKMLTEALVEGIKKLAITENDSSAKHNFFIGLAYLGGVDVEVDHEKALSLITYAAENGLPEAIEKLVSMYRNGEVVERNYDTAIEWQKRLVEYYEKLFEKDETGEIFDKYYFSLRKLGKYEYELRKQSDAMQTCLKMCELAKRRVFENSTTKTKRELVASYNMLGDIALAKRDFTLAKAYYNDGLAINERLAQEEDSFETKKQLEISFEKLGNTAKAEKNLPLAKEYYEKGFEICKLRAEENYTDEVKRCISISYSSLGDIAQAQGNLALAREYYEKSLAISKELSAENGTVEARLDLYISYDMLGDLSKSEGKVGLAKDYYEKGHTVIEQLALESSSVDIQKGRAWNYYKLGGIATAEGNVALAKECYEKGLVIAERLSAETDVSWAKMFIRTFCIHLAPLAMADGELALARFYYERGAEICEILGLSKHFSRNYIELARIAEAEGNTALAKKYRLKASASKT